jgi:type I restriction enzyme M protein
MLDTVTKRRIDTARDILVGKVPDPKSQVEQITIALIYKFMDDIDAEAEEFGGKRQFFADDFARYGWAKLMRSGLGGFEILNLYAEGIAKMPENPGIPLLFRNIFKNAYLPYRDPETLRAFLKIIDEFNYDHSERLGDAFEYLLSVLGSQGDAGHETILDPACGTAGFLISSYKHILKSNTDAKGNSTLTPDEKGRLAKNLKGYDISPDMVRLSLVNMYLHGFADPHIYEYDTLTSLDHWNEYADVILANPPFMSPKGGIRPHNRFSVQSKRSEVLFVDYMAEHLTPNGRAGIIVPEGIIFQSQGAYTQLRKMLVEEYLVAVVSLPAGVFNPYSGVKTSILILDKSLAKKTATIAFFKVENDGFGLGAQRRSVDKDDLPQARAEIGEYLCHLRSGESVKDFQPSLGLIVSKEKIAANGDYNLSVERYREGAASTSTFPMIDLGEVCELVRGVVFSKDDEISEGGVQVLRANNINKDHHELNLEDIKRVAPRADFSDEKKLRKDDIFICLASGSKDHIGKVALISDDTTFYIGGFMGAIRVKAGRLHPSYLLKQLTTGHFNAFLRKQIAGANINNLSGGLLYRFRIPLPPLEVQKEIVAEIEGYQKVIDGARAVLENYRPHIPIDPTWQMATLGEVCIFKRGPFGGSLKKEIFVKNGYAVYEQSHAIANDFSEFRYFIDEDKFDEMRGFQVRPGELIMSCSGTMGRVAIIPDNAPSGVINQALLKLTPTDRVLGVFLKLWMESTNFQQSLADFTYGAAIKNVASVEILKGLRLPLPSLATQQAIVAEIEAEQALVAANRELIARFEKKIQATLARIWGEETRDAL